MRNPNEFGELRKSFTYRLHIRSIRIFFGFFVTELLLVLGFALELLPDEAAALAIAAAVIGAGAVILLIVTTGRVSKTLRDQGELRSIDAQIPYLRNLISDIFNLK